MEVQTEKNTNFVSKIWWTVFRSRGNCKRSIWANVTALYFCHAFVTLKIIRNCLQGKGPVSKISLGPLSSVRDCLYPRHPESSVYWGRQHIMEWALIQWDPTFLELINWNGSGSWTSVSWCLCCACCSVGLLCSLPSLHLLFLLFCLLLEHSLAVEKIFSAQLQGCVLAQAGATGWTLAKASAGFAVNEVPLLLEALHEESPERHIPSWWSSQPAAGGVGFEVTNSLICYVFTGPTFFLCCP